MMCCLFDSEGCRCIWTHGRGMEDCWHGRSRDKHSETREGCRCGHPSEQEQGVVQRNPGDDTPICFLFPYTYRVLTWIDSCCMCTSIYLMEVARLPMQKQPTRTYAYSHTHTHTHSQTQTQTHSPHTGSHHQSAPQGHEADESVR